MDGGFDDDEPFIFRLNDSGTGPGLLVKVCAERGWRMYPGYHSGLEERWNLWWKTSAFPAASYKTLGDWQHASHVGIEDDAVRTVWISGRSCMSFYTRQTKTRCVRWGPVDAYLISTLPKGTKTC
uniref:SFRICE_033143 n=1 Tax=Spodoptera frugiperda TaxID=7108 RepID=A0A2H1VDW8_SPOFR